MARAGGPAKKKPDAEGEKKLSTADILAAARAKKGAAEDAKPKAEKGKPSTADILAAARGEKKAASAKASDAPAAKPAAKKSDSAPAKAEPKKMSTADILAAARAGTSAAKSDAAETAAPPATESEAEVEVETKSERETKVDHAETAAEEKVAPSGSVAKGDLPTSTAEIIAYCRRVDGDQ